MIDEKGLEARRAYKRKWAAENRDRVRKYQDAYWNKRAQAEAEAAKKRGEIPAEEAKAQ